MLTPIEIRGRSFKSGMGYVKKQVDAFLEEVCNDYERLYKENVELKDKLGTLSEGIQYYKNIEKTLEKALVLAEKTSEETRETAKKKAGAIETEARARAKMIVADAKNETERLKGQITGLVRQYEKYRMQFKQLASSQLELLENTSYHMELPEERPGSEEENRPLEVISTGGEEERAQADTSGLKKTAQTMQKERIPEEPAEEETPDTEQDDFAVIEEALRRQGELAPAEGEAPENGDGEAEISERETSGRSGAMSDILKRLNHKIALAEEEDEEPPEESKAGKPESGKQDDAFEFLDND